jgi:multiple sugar transport system substrate-binding protein
VETFGLKPGKPYDGTTLKFLICCHNVGQFYSLDEKSKQFTDLTGIKVEWGDVPWGAFQEQLMQEAATGGSTYDLMAWADAWGPGMAAFLEPLDKYIAADNYNLADYPQAYVDPGKNTKGEQIGVPFRGHAFTLFYRKDVFDKLGLKPPTTWAEYEEAAKKIQENTDLDGTAQYLAVSSGQNLFTWESLLWSNGGDIFDKDLKPIFNNEAGVEATQRYVDWLQKQKITADGAKAWNEGEAANELTAGRAAMWLGWSWYYSNFTDKALVAPEVLGNVGFAPPPAWEGKGAPATYGYIWEASIPPGSKHKEAAWEYLKWMTNPITEKKVVMDKSSSNVANVVAVHNSVLKDPEVNAIHDNLHANIAAVLKDAKMQPTIADWLQVQSLLEVAINEIANGADIKTKLDQAAVDVEELLQRQGYYNK